MRRPAACRWRSVFQRLQIGRGHPLADLASKRQSILAGRAEVYASIDTRIRALLCSCRKAGEGPLDVSERRAAGHGECHLVSIEDDGKHCSRRATEQALRGRIV